ncbi:phosphoadenylyl-sulfate reductase [Caenimonas soli]|uniref:phosphoadenylyl-sulfate reductase n=1 Tax=Caenimonas soli TaxID=2735555 RepID=UPI0015536490|nr:phosphoadenylyl-sulfate reductase [Caenimonas soli]
MSAAGPSQGAKAPSGGSAVHAVSSVGAQRSSAIDLHARASATFEAKLAETKALLQSAAADFAPITQASSLGAEDVVITHLINSLELDIPVFVLETGMLHQQTLDLLERTRATSRAPVNVYRPVNEAVIQFVAREGNEPMYKSIELRKACCHIRKVEPLERALAGKRAWITGLRREQSNARAEVPLTDTSDEAKTGRIKFNPLANWTWGDVWHYISVNKVDYNPLHDEFYPSIGCAPCTRAISLGEDFRAGRWWWEDEAAKECGLHVKNDETKEKASA